MKYSEVIITIIIMFAGIYIVANLHLAPALWLPGADLLPIYLKDEPLLTNANNLLSIVVMFLAAIAAVIFLKEMT